VEVQDLPQVVEVALVVGLLVDGMTDKVGVAMVATIAIVGKGAIIAADSGIVQSAVSSFLTLKLGLCLLRTECVLWLVKLRKLAGLTLFLRLPQ